jgi:hypothetical protein
MLKDIANSTGASLSTRENTVGGSYLWEHADPSSSTGAATLSLLDRSYDYVVLQDHSQTPGGGRVNGGGGLPEGESKRRSMEAITNTFAPRMGGATPILYSTWGHRDGSADLNPTLYPDFQNMNDRTTEGYADYASLLPSPLIVPAGRAFEIVSNNNANPAVTFRQLYWSNNDGSHPSKQGTYMVACLFYATIFSESPTTISFRPSGVTNAEASFLRDVAARALAPPGLGDPTCASGIANDSACCSAACGACGGQGCGALPGGGSSCCKATVIEDAPSCDSNLPPCVLSTPDPTCSSGIANGLACCSAACGACGGQGCGALPGGGSSCCIGTVIEEAPSCDFSLPPCVLSAPDPALVLQRNRH